MENILKTRNTSKYTSYTLGGNDFKKENESFFKREYSRISSITKLKCSFLAGFIEYLFERHRPYDPTYMWNPNKQNKWINKTKTDS